MRKVLWIFLIFILLLSVSSLYAQTEVSVAKDQDESSIVVKESKKVSEVRTVYVPYKPKVKHNANVIQNNAPSASSKAVTATQKVVTNKKSSKVKKIYRKPYVEKKNMVNSKTVKSTTLEAKSAD